MAVTDANGLDVAFDFAGVPAVRDQAFGVLGSYGSRPEHLEQLVKLVSRGRLDLAGSVSDVLPLSEAADAVRRLESKEGNPIRLILRP